MNKHIQVFTTTANKKSAQKIAKILVEKKLAACVQILGPIESVYQWKGKIEKAKEFLLLIKSNQSKAKKIIDEIKSVHDYEVPEIIVLPIASGNPDYLRWVDESVK